MTKDEYMKNIQIVDIDLTNIFWWDKITIKIIDNNKKLFKKRKLHREYLEITNIDTCLKDLINYYVWDNYGYIYRKDELNEMLKKWKEKSNE